MRNWGCQLYMPEALTPNLGKNDLNPTLLTDDTFVLHPLIFSAGTLPVFDWTKNFSAE